ncbi:MAG: GNAT family N-acetyltransferase [Candidatus Heteroscillospira sp.]|jgi:GNAT superfamily N-acetyltransferase
MIRPATENDIGKIAKIYEHIHEAEEAGEAVIGWERNVYPTYQTALEGLAKEDMFVEENEQTIVAAGRINQEQVKEYADCPWLYQAPDNEVMVLHTLVVDPQIKGKGYGSEFVKFYEEYAASRNCRYLRIDTQEKNMSARKFYKKLGFREAGIVFCNFNGIPDVRLVCLEKKI